MNAVEDPFAAWYVVVHEPPDPIDDVEHDCATDDTVDVNEH